MRMRLCQVMMTSMDLIVYVCKQHQPADVVCTHTHETMSTDFMTTSACINLQASKGAQVEYPANHALRHRIALKALEHWQHTVLQTQSTHQVWFASSCPSVTMRLRLS